MPDVLRTSFPAVQHATSADGTPVAYRASGTGEPMLLVHGSATSSADWSFVLPHLLEHFSVITMDRRGRGRSGDSGDYAMAREAEDIAAVLDAVGAEVLVGHSYGALCCIELAATGRDLRRLVLYEPPIAVREHAAAAVDTLVRAGELDRALEGFLLGAGAPRDQFDLIRGSAAWPVLRESVPALPRELHAAAIWRHPAQPIDTKTLFLLGANTRGEAFLDRLDDLQSLFPDARQELLAGQQHIAHVFDARRFADVLIGFCAP